MSYVIYWLDREPGLESKSKHEEFGDHEFDKAMELMASLRKKGSCISHIGMVSELLAMVGKHGVDSVVDGKTPDGEEYEWSKAGRAGRMRSADHQKVHKKPDEQ